jgi:hypothetical protein
MGGADEGGKRWQLLGRAGLCGGGGRRAKRHTSEGANSGCGAARLEEGSRKEEGVSKGRR